MWAISQILKSTLVTPNKIVGRREMSGSKKSRMLRTFGRRGVQTRQVSESSHLIQNEGKWQ